MLDLLTVQSSAAYPTVITMVYTLLLAFVCSTAIGFTYEHTFLGLSYSRNFVQALVLSSVVAATVMQAIGDNVGRGLGTWHIVSAYDAVHQRLKALCADYAQGADSV